MVFEWDKRYTTGIPEIDADHRCLVQYINQAFELMSEGDGEGILKVLENLRTYAEGHFSSEVFYMDQAKYPNKDLHVKSHNDFIHQLKKFETHHIENPLRLTIRVALYLNDWLHDHLLGEDKRLFEHVGSIPPPK